MDPLLEQLIDHHPDGCALVELDGDCITILRVNRLHAARFGLRPAELAGVEASSFAPPALVEVWLRWLRAALAADAAQVVDLDSPRPTGGRERVIIVPLGPGASGQPRFLIQVRDETERLAAEEALVRSEARLARAQEVGQVGDFVVDLATGAATWSRQLFRDVGWPGEVPPTFEQFLDLVHPDDRAAFLAHQDRVRSSAGPVEHVFRLVTPRGELRRFATTVVTERDQAGRPRRLVGVNRDITALEDALALARLHEAELQVLFDDNPDGVYFVALDRPIVWDETTDKTAAADRVLDRSRLTRVNRALADMHRVPVAALRGLPLAALVADREEGRRQVRAIFDQGSVRIASFTAVRPDGTSLVIDTDTVGIRDAGGRFIGLFGIVRDVTARDQAVAEQRQSEARLKLALESGALFYWELDVATGALVTDPRLAARLGYQADELTTLEAAERTCHPDDRSRVARSFAAVMTGRINPDHSSHRLVTRSGEVLWVEASVMVTARDADGGPRRLIGLARDVTAHHELERRLSIAERMAALGTLAAGVGHEINNPLTYVVTNLALIDDALGQLIAQPPPGADQRRELVELREMTADARDGAARVARIVRDLRSLSRSDEAPAERIDLPALLERCLELADHQLRHRARVVRDLPPVPPVAGHLGKLTQLFLNLLVNAAQAIPEGAAAENQVRVSTRAEPGRVVVEVADTGAGMAPEVAARIFDPFFTTKAVGEGVGLGLAICASIARDLGGAIDVDSAPGRGAVFRVTLPAAPREAEEPAAAPGPVRPVATAPLRILVIDDEPMIGRLIGHALEGHAVVAETRAAEALRRLRDGERFDRILCDLMMPEMSGVDFYQELAAVDPRLPARVIFMTGGAFTERAARFLRSIPNPRIDKPFEPDELRALLADGQS
jgi:PAS domain S-box-containing protein